MAASWESVRRARASLHPEEPDEDTASYLVNGTLLVDAGWNAALSMQRYGADPVTVTHALFTHCHQDHTLGLPGLLFALPAVCAGAAALPQGDRYPDCVPPHEVTIVQPGDVVRLGALEVRVSRAFHPLDARCYRLVDTQTGGSVVFTGDTAYHAGLARFAAGCDVLVHEAAAGELVLVHLSAGQRASALERAQQACPRPRLARAGERMVVRGPGQVEWTAS